MPPYTLIDVDLLDRLSATAAQRERRRANHNLHATYDEACQRFLNAMEPDSYIRPHRHLTHPKPESFLVLRGRLLFIVFDDEGAITDAFVLSSEGTRGIDLEPGLWHAVVSLEPGTVFYEAKPGPYVPLTAKDFAPWAPDEGTETVDIYLEELRRLALARAVAQRD